MADPHYRTKSSVTLARSLLLHLRRAKSFRAALGVRFSGSLGKYTTGFVSCLIGGGIQRFQPQWYQILPLEELGSRTSTCRWCSSPRYHYGCQMFRFQGRGRGVVGRSRRPLPKEKQKRDDYIVLERGFATIPLPGIDVSFHSRYLWAGVMPFRACESIILCAIKFHQVFVDLGKRSTSSTSTQICWSDATSRT